MSLDPKSVIIAKLSAAMAANAMPALRLAVSEAASNGFTNEEIQNILHIATEIKAQPNSHTEHMVKHLLHEPVKSQHVHGPGCNCLNN